MENQQQTLVPTSVPTVDIPRLPAPPVLRTICSISCALDARDLVGLLRENEVSAFLDTRVGRSYRGKGIATHEDDLRFLLELAGISYEIVPSLMPTREMRSEFAARFKDVKRAPDRDPEAWTTFLSQYEQVLQQRRPLRTEQLRSIIYGNHQSIAIACACRHHDDCHRSYACGLLSTVLSGVEQRILYPGGTPPKHSSPRRYRTKAFHWAMLDSNNRSRR